MCKKGLILKAIIISFIIMAIMLLLPSSSQIIKTQAQSHSIDDNISADEFFEELITRLNISTKGLEDYSYCSPWVAYLVDKGYISPYQTSLISKGNYNAEFLIDKGLLLVGYFERPLDEGEYNSIIDRTLKETGIVDKSFNSLGQLKRADAINIIDKIVNDKFTRIKYSLVGAKINYKIDNFYGMASSVEKTLYYIDMLPQSCINEFNRRHFTLRIVENATDVHPYKRNNVAAFINFNTNEICIMRGFEQDIIHEFGHLMFDKIRNKNSVCKYLYKAEGKYRVLFGDAGKSNDAEEYCANMFANYVLYKDDEEYIRKFKDNCPMTYNFIQNIISKDVYNLSKE